MSVLTSQPAALAPPDLSLDGLLRRFPGLEAARAVCLSGSLARGWENPYSDIDLFAFSDDPLKLPVDDTMETWDSTDPSGLRWLNWMGRYGDTRVDIKVWPERALEVVLEPFTDGREPELCESGPFVEDLVYRLSVARPVLNEPFVLGLRETIATSSFGRALARWVKHQAENRLTDVAGQLQIGDALGARLSAAEAAAFAADCCLILTGDYCRTTKWLLRRIEEAPQCGITVDEYVATALSEPRDGEDLAGQAIRIARWAQQHVMRVEDAVLTTA